ncbi:hypothetical protein HaLaN_03249 [Haematococcus lacustris]|uniref:Uncharacterized protein n=1 Tax=Haematococcus lacustris TaxID=44745 RepID=A0A699YK34_HAELA|nr:hypothetical protein HaLaN_03249 [Haematococcus lacustris]
MGLAVLAAEFQLHSLMALGCALLTPWATAQHPPAPPFPSPSASPPPPGQRAALAVAAAALALATEQGWALQPDQGLVAPGVVLVRSGVSDGQYIQAVLRRAGADLGLAGGEARRLGLHIPCTPPNRATWSLVSPRLAPLQPRPQTQARLTPPIHVGLQEMPGDELLEAVASLAADLAYLLEQDKQAALLGASLAPGAAFTPFSSPPPPSPVNDRSEALDRSSNSSDNAINGLLQLRGHSLALSPWADAANPVTLVTRVAGATRLLARAVAAVRRAGRVGMAADDASALLQPFSTASLPTMMAEQEGVCEGDVQVALGLGAPPAAVGMRTGAAVGKCVNRCGQ